MKKRAELAENPRLHRPVWSESVRLDTASIRLHELEGRGSLTGGSLSFPMSCGEIHGNSMEAVELGGYLVESRTYLHPVPQFGWKFEALTVSAKYNIRI